MKVENFSFGNLTFGGKRYTHDLKIVDREPVPDWWRREGHNLFPEDIADVLAAGPDYLVVGTGSPGRMRVSPETLDALKERGIEEIILPTAQAVEKFNELTDRGARVAGAFHLTC